MSKHRSYDVNFKLQAIDWYKENGRNIAKTAREFNVDRKRIRDWLAIEEFLRSNSKGPASKQKRFGSGKECASMELDMGVLEFLLDERAAGRAVSNNDLKGKAVEIAQDIGMSQFKGSDGWLTKWKRRNSVGIGRGTNESKIPENFQEQIREFREAIKAQRVLNEYIMSHIGNLGEIMCRFDMAPDITNIHEQRDIGGSKKGFTVALAATADGVKLPAYIIFKEPRGRIPPKVYAKLQIPNNVCVSATVSGWMTGDEMASWLNLVWGQNQDDVRRLLILDQARAHTMQSTRVAMDNFDTDLVFIPAGCTTVAQPADVSWNAPFRRELRAAWKEWRRADQSTARENVKMADRQEVINWVSRAWESLSEDIIIHSFKTTGISTALDGSEDHLLGEQLSQAGNVANVRDDDAAILFDNDGEDSEADFSGFGDVGDGDEE